MQIVVRHKQTGQFLAGQRWVSEYPDATVYENVLDAIKAATGKKLTCLTAELIADYGLDTERDLGAFTKGRR